VHACWEWGCLRVLRAWGRLGLIRLPPYGSRQLYNRTSTHPPAVLPASHVFLPYEGMHQCVETLSIFDWVPAWSKNVLHVLFSREPASQVEESLSEMDKSGQNLINGGCLSTRKVRASSLHPSSPRPTMRAVDAVPLPGVALATSASLKSAIGAVAAALGLSDAALYKAYYRKRDGAVRQHDNRLLTWVPEEALLGVVQTFSVNSVPLSDRQIAEVFKNRCGMDASTQFVGRCVTSHWNQLSMRACKTLSEQQAGPEVHEDVRGFCEQLSLYPRFTPSPS